MRVVIHFCSEFLAERMNTKNLFGIVRKIILLRVRRWLGVHPYSAEQDEWIMGAIQRAEPADGERLTLTLAKRRREASSGI